MTHRQMSENIHELHNMLVAEDFPPHIYVAPDIYDAWERYTAANYTMVMNQTRGFTALQAWGTRLIRIDAALAVPAGL